MCGGAFKTLRVEEIHGRTPFLPFLFEILVARVNVGERRSTLHHLKYLPASTSRRG